MRASIIIPTLGRAGFLAEALRSILLTEPAQSDTEIVVVDNDPTGDRHVRALCDAHQKSVRYAAEPAPGQTAARHRGAREARGEILIYIDDDVRVAPDWLDAILGAFEDPEIGMVGGPSVPAFAAPVPDWLWDFLQPTPYGGWHCGWLSLLDIGRSVADVDPIWIWGLNLAIRKDALSTAGGFHPDLVPRNLQRWQGDGETGLGLRLRERGIRSAFVEEALLQHVIPASRLTPEAFERRAYYQGVCDSFTSIRAGATPDPSSPGPKQTPQRNEATPWSRAAYDVRLRTVAAYNEGWSFHQREAAGDPRLLQWVRRQDFRDADIRDETSRTA